MSGKGGKALKVGKSSRSDRAGLQFPVGRIGQFLKNGNFATRVGALVPVYLAAVLEYLCTEILELAGNAARDNKKSRIIPRHVQIAVLNDKDLSKIASQKPQPPSATTLEDIDVVESVVPPGAIQPQCPTQNGSKDQSAKQKVRTSGYIGVHWHRGANKWVAQISIDGKRTHLGYFSNSIDAAKKYDIKAKELGRPTNIYDTSSENSEFMTVSGLTKMDLLKKATEVTL